jgi:hypothetical protein
MNGFTEIFQSIIGAVTIAVDARFPALKVYADEGPQKLPDRCFIVSLDDVSSRKAFGRRYELKGIVDIGYYSPLMAVDRDGELNGVFAGLADIDVVQCGELPVALPSKTRAPDTGALHVRCPFTVHVYQVPEDPLMGEITKKEELK